MIRVLVAGIGNMGRSHALAYHAQPDFEIVGLVNRTPPSLPDELTNYDFYTDFDEALALTKPDLVCIATYSDSHAAYAIAAMKAGAHVFVEKPLATTVEDAIAVAKAAATYKRKLVVGYILRHHPSWQQLIQEARALGGPYVFRLNLNQQSKGAEWATHMSMSCARSPMPAQHRCVAWGCACRRKSTKACIIMATFRSSSPMDRSVGMRLAGAR